MTMASIEDEDEEDDVGEEELEPPSRKMVATLKVRFTVMGPIHLICLC